MRYRFMRFPDGKSKAVTFSYDDGCDADARLIEVINRYGIKCTFNLNGDRLRNGAGLSKEQVEELVLANGHEVAVHGDFHRANGTLRPIEGIMDVLDCRLELESKYNIIIRGMAYPDSGITNFSNNASYSAVKSYLEELDIAYARTLGGDNNLFMLPDDWHAWMPSVHSRNPKVLDYIDEFIRLDLSTNVYDAKRAPRLFYMWGHSYEFDRNNNWELLDAICEKLKTDNEIWYATNIEIYNYVNAYNSLVFSADGTMIYNPTLLNIWFDVDGKEYCIESGETLVLR